MNVQKSYHKSIAERNWFKLTPVVLLLSIWLISGRSDPGAHFQDLSYLRWLSYPVILIAGSLWAIKFTRVPIIKITGIEPILIGIIITIIISSLLNNDSLENSALGALIYLRYPVLFLLLTSNIETTEELQPFIKTLVLVMFLIIFEASCNFLLLGYEGDQTFISLGNAWGTQVAGIWLLYAYLIFFANFMMRKRKKTIWLLILGGLVMGVFVVASIRTGVLYLPILILLMLTIYANKITPRILPICAGIIVLSTLGFALFTYFTCNGTLSLPQWINPQYRLNYIAGVMDQLYLRGQLLFGAGARSMAPGNFGSGGSLYQYFNVYQEDLLRSGTNQYVKIIPELGIVGLVLYWGVLYKMINFNMFVWNKLRHEEDGQLMDKAVSLSFFPIWIHYSALGLFNNDLWRFDISSLIFWTMSSYIYTLYFKYNSTCKSYLIRR
ncbi:MAG: hypothetical protein K9L30_17405 [Desulfobacterales bacterium]|nr:hypothetical protein [Desulfobacterales bacterium]